MIKRCQRQEKYHYQNAIKSAEKRRCMLDELTYSRGRGRFEAASAFCACECVCVCVCEGGGGLERDLCGLSTAGRVVLTVGVCVSPFHSLRAYTDPRERSAQLGISHGISPSISTGKNTE